MRRLIYKEDPDGDREIIAAVKMTAGCAVAILALAAIAVVAGVIVGFVRGVL